jgi:hypothetical protein
MDYSVGHFFEAYALFYAGEWGATRRLQRSAIDMANRNGHDFWVLLFSLLDAMLRLETFSAEDTLRDCQDYLVRAKALDHPLSIQISLVLLGKAQLGVHDLDGAQRTFDEIIRWQGRERILMDWIWRLPLQFNYVELCLARQEIDAALSASELFLSQTARTAEKTWNALSHLERAKIAALQRDAERLQSELAAGFQLVETNDIPLAAWRLHAVAAHSLGSPEHLGKAQAIVSKLAASLGQEAELKQCFLSAPEVTAIASRHSATARI